MTLWLIIGGIALASMTGLAWPLLRAGGRSAVGDPAAAVFRHQLAEIAGEVERGLTTPEESRALEAEIGRRILRTAKLATEAESPPAEPSRWMSRAALLIVISVPAGAIGLYARLGAPELPDMPLAARSMETEKAAS